MRKGIKLTVNMNIRDLKFTKDEFSLIIPINNIFIPSLNCETEIWFDSETAEQKKPTNKQWKVFKDFLKIDNKEISKASVRLNEYKDELLSEKRIIKRVRKNYSFQDLNFRNIILPQQSKTTHNYLIVLADTNWKNRYCKHKFVIELEILFKNNQFELLQEMTGLWTRLDWNYLYNVKFEPLLSQALTEVSEHLENDSEIYYNLFRKGHNIIVEYKNSGGTEGNAYNTIYSLYLNNREKNDALCEYREDLITDWLDCVCGYIGNPEWKICW